MATEWRLVVDRGFAPTPKHYPKRDAAHAAKGLADAVRDFERLPDLTNEPKAWVETRTVTEWKKVTDVPD